MPVKTRSRPRKVYHSLEFAIDPLQWVGALATLTKPTADQTTFPFVRITRVDTENRYSEDEFNDFQCLYIRHLDHHSIIAALEDDSIPDQWIYVADEAYEGWVGRGEIDIFHKPNQALGMAADQWKLVAQFYKLEKERILAVSQVSTHFLSVHALCALCTLVTSLLCVHPLLSLLCARS